MKKLILFLFVSTSVIGMSKIEMPVKAASQNTLLQPTDENLSRILSSGSYNDLKTMLDNRIVLPTRIFLNKLFNEKSLLQATLELQVGLITGKDGRYKIANLLLEKGADRNDLNAYLVPAIERADEQLVVFLIENGAQDLDGKAAQAVANQLQKQRLPDVKRDALLRIQNKLPGRQSLMSPVIKRQGKGPVLP